MLLEVRLFATFRQGRFKMKEIQLPEGLLLGELLVNLDISKKDVGILLVNGRHSNEDAILNAGDTVAIFPAVGGG
jgi:sulfur carrier protein